MRFSHKLRAISFVLTFALILGLFSPFSLQVKAASYKFTEGAVVISEATGFSDGDTITILQGVYSVTVDSVDVHIIFGSYNAETNTKTGVKIDRTEESVSNGVIGTQDTGYTSLSVLYTAGQSLCQNAKNLNKAENVWEKTTNSYYVPTAPFLIMGDANVEAIFYGDCEFRAGKNGVYLTSNSDTTIQSDNTEVASGSWAKDSARGGYAGIQIEGGASLTINNADNLSAYGAYQNEGDPATEGAWSSGSNDQNASGGAGIGGGAPPCPKTAMSEDYTYGTPGNITILNGTVFAKGGHQAAGIGGGLNSAATTGAIKLLGGDITAQGGKHAAGIGEGDSVQYGTSEAFYAGDAYEIVIGGDTSKELNVTALGGFFSAGIGTTDYVNNQRSLLHISIYSGNVNALSGMGNAASAAIGAGNMTDMLDNSIAIYSDAYISAASFSQYAITNYGTTQTAVPVVNLDPNAYMYLARFPNGVSDADREFPLFPVKHIQVGETLCPILVDASSSGILSADWNASEHKYYAYDASANKYYSLTQTVGDDGSVTFSDPVALDDVPEESLSYYFEDPIMRTSDGKQIFMSAPSASILEDDFKSDETINFYAQDGTSYYLVNRDGEYIDVNGNVVTEADRVSATVSATTTLYRYYDISKVINIYTVPESYKAIALTLPDPSQYGGAYVLEAPDAGENDEDVYSVIKKYNAGVTSGEVVFENAYHMVNGTEYINLKEDTVADDLIDLNVGLGCDTENFRVLADLLNYQTNVRSYTIYVPSDTETFYMDFLYSNTNSKGATVKSVSLTSNTGVTVTGQGSTSIATGGALSGGTVTTDTTAHAFKIQFQNGETRADLWLRKTDNLPENASGTEPYIVYKVTVIVKPVRYLELNDLSKTYDGNPVEPEVLAMMDSKLNFTDSWEVVTGEPGSVSYSAIENETTIISEQSVSLQYGWNDQDIIIISSSVLSNGSNSETIVVETNFTSNTTTRTVVTTINLTSRTVQHTIKNNQTAKIGNFDIVTGSSSYLRLTSSNDWYSYNYNIFEVNIEEPTVSTPSLGNDVINSIVSNARTEAEDAFENNPNLVTFQKAYAASEQNATVNQAVTFESDVANVTNSPLSIEGTAPVATSIEYVATMGGDNNKYDLTEDDLDAIQFEYWLDVNDDGAIDENTDIKMYGAPFEACVYQNDTYYNGIYLVKASLIADTYEAEGMARFEISKRELKITAVENWLTYLEADDIASLQNNAQATWPLDITNTPWLIEKAGAITYEVGNLVSGDEIRLNPDIIYYYTPATISYSATKITLKLQSGDADKWLIYDGLDNGAYANRNYTLTNISAETDGATTTKVPGSLAYKVDRAIFKKAELADAYWRKFWPAWRETPLSWVNYNEYGIATEAAEGENDIDYRSPNNVSHRDYLWLRTLNCADDENRYSVDIEFGAMSFTHSKSVWDVNQYEYVEVSGESQWSGNDGVNNRISITNRSNVYIHYKIDLELDDFYGQGIIANISDRGDTYEPTDLKADLAWCWANVDPNMVAEPHIAEKYLYLSGVPFAESPAGGTGAGTITITIQPSTMTKELALGTS